MRSTILQKVYFDDYLILPISALEIHILRRKDSQGRHFEGGQAFFLPGYLTLLLITDSSINGPMERYCSFWSISSTGPFNDFLKFILEIPYISNNLLVAFILVKRRFFSFIPNFNLFFSISRSVTHGLFPFTPKL